MGSSCLWPHLAVWGRISAVGRRVEQQRNQICVGNQPLLSLLLTEQLVCLQLVVRATSNGLICRLNVLEQKLFTGICINILTIFNIAAEQ